MNATGTSNLPDSLESIAPACPICGSASRRDRRHYDDRYGYPGSFWAYRCISCGHVRLDVAMTAEEIGQLYTRYYPRAQRNIDDWQAPREEPALKTWWLGLKASAFRWVPRNVRVLDIGCGFGESLGYHASRGCDAHGVEPDANVLPVAARYGLNIRTGLFEAAAYTEPFDFVTLDQVVEHVADPVRLLRDVASILKEDGTVIVSTPNLRGWGAAVFRCRWIHWHSPYHQQFFTRSSMQRAAAAAGLRVVGSHTVTNSAWLGFQWCHLAAPTAPGQPSPFWNRNVPRSLGHRIAFACSAVADRIGLNALLTRLFDACGLGDNFVFVLRKMGGPR